MARFAGETKCGKPILLVNVAPFRPYAFDDVDDFIRYVSYFFERFVLAVRRAQPNSGQGYHLQVGRRGDGRMRVSHRA